MGLEFVNCLGLNSGGKQIELGPFKSACEAIRYPSIHLSVG